MNMSDWMDRTLLLDLETTRTGKIRHVGAIFRDQVFEKAERAGSRAALSQLDSLAQKADFILGHNLLGHDFPILQAASPWLGLLKKPVIDTLYLSPLAFPQNPYHRLVKNYKLVRAAVSSPVEDAKLAASVFADQWESFTSLSDKDPTVLILYRFCFEDSLFNSFPGTGISAVFSALSPQAIHSDDAALQCFSDLTAGMVCPSAVEKTLPGLLAEPDRRPAVAFCLAWLRVAGGNSVLPPWVRHRFPAIPEIIRAFRETPCGAPDCDFCRENHDPERQLTRFFGYPSFRNAPKTEDGRGLQRAIVVDCMGNVPTLGLLPTGGGKSLCYQLPALVRYWRRGALTVVISPLQALMKDQVDNLVKKTRTLFADAVYGLQTPPERGEVFERIRMGDIAVLYLAPEQLRSFSVRNVLKQREIGCWVFDEAHCLSKWGHDFRPDYLYAARFIREFAKEQNLPVPPVCCFTATAKKSVIEEICTHFQAELHQSLHVYAGGVERTNLSFEVIPITAAEKLERTHEIVEEQIRTAEEPVGVIVYAATRKETETVRDFLRHQGMSAEAFHGGLDTKVKREIIEAFVDGEVPVICATNAFGMGIDKENIRLVLHYQMPGSLENYIQEAGRAGRDLKPARCVLFYDSQDASGQFSLGALSEVKQKEIARILRALRRKKRNQYGEIVVTSDELLRDDDLADMKRLDPGVRDTKVKASIAWLERAGFLERNQNLTDAFQGKPLITSLDDAERIMDRFDLHPDTRKIWLNILQYIINTEGGGGIRADELAEALFPEKDLLLAKEKQTGLTPAQFMISALHDMADAGLIDQGILLSAIFRPKGKNSAPSIFQEVCALENKLIKVLQSEDPDADDGNWVPLNIRRLNQKMANEGYDTSPEALRLLIKGISYDGKGFAASQGSFELKYIDRNHYQVRLQRSWNNIRKTIFLRQGAAYVILQTLVAMAKEKLAESTEGAGGDVHLSFTSDALSAAIRSDITLNGQVTKLLPVIDRALLFMHEHKVITLQNGLAVLRQAMTIRMLPGGKRRSYSKGDFKPLATHYMEKRLQVHVMMRYALLGLEKYTEALGLVLDYFALGRVKFINKYFGDDKALLEKATTAEAYRAIVEKLRNPVQIGAVGRPVEDNMLILAGPGSGKTTVIVHRCAYLVEVERIPARQILVLCFNHSSAVVLRNRLKKLIGRAAGGVTVATYHGAAMRLAGISIRDMAESHAHDIIDFDGIIRSAIQLLKGEKEIVGIDADEVRERLLGGYSHILVDEYQDIDEDQYELVSAIAGRTLEEEDGRLTLLAVGDDDQNIYTFRGANVRFIRRFQEDYSKNVIYLVENYRSSGHIIASSNALIRNNRDRMKGDHPICINRDREPTLPGGRWEQIDPVARGQVQIVAVRDLLHQAGYIKTEIDRIRSIDPSTDWHDFAVLSRTKAPMAAIRSVLEQAAVPIRTTLEQGLPLHRVREIQVVLDHLTVREKENHRASWLRSQFNAVGDNSKENIWWQQVDAFFNAYIDETADSVLPVGRTIDRLYEFLAEQRREKVVGHGVFLSTIHSAKGMEFPHVFILDGDWRPSGGAFQWEEERRVLYVGMTRAEETLRLLKIPSRPNPFLKELRGNPVLPLTYRGDSPSDEHAAKRYDFLGLHEVFMDYAGSFPQGHPIHTRLAGLDPGAAVSFQPNHSKIEVHDTDGHYLARLSNEGTKKWGPRLERVQEVRVVAMLQRNRDDPDESYQSRIMADRWELPVLEVVSNGQ